MKRTILRLARAVRDAADAIALQVEDLGETDDMDIARTVLFLGGAQRRMARATTALADAAGRTGAGSRAGAKRAPRSP